MDFFEAREIVDQISYKKGWKIHLFPTSQGAGCLQIEVRDSVDAHTGEPTTWKSGKRHLSSHACKQEVVGTTFDLIKAAEMHEVHEFFRYKGRSIYCPHLDPDVLAEVAAKKESFNTRTQNAMNPD